MSSFLEALSQAPEARVLFIDGDRRITAGDIRAAARRAAAWMGESRELVFLHTESAALLSAGLLAGALARRMLAVLPHAQPAYLAEVGATAKHLLTDDGVDAPLRIAPGDASPIKVDAESDLVFFTSGSTGAPKRVLKKMSNLDAEIAYWAKAWSGRIDHVAGSVSHQHIYGMTFRVLLPVLAGWRATDRQAFVWEDFAAQMSPRCLAVTSPAHLRRIPPGLRLSHGKPSIVLSAGQLLPLGAAQEAALLFGAPPLEILGSTETGAIATRQRDHDAEPWRPLPGMAISLDEDGALLVRSPFIGEITQRMGDLIDLLSDGRFHLRGRADRIVKIEGKRISLTRVEEVLKKLPETADAAIAVIDAEAGDVLGAAVVLTPEAGSELARLGAFRFSRKLREKLAAHLEPAERPKRWRFVGRVPVNTQGKRVAADIAALFEGGSLIQTLDAQVEPTSDNDVRIAFVVKPELSWFDGHFPSRPILAGVAQTHIAVRLAEEVWGFLPSTFQVTRLKFRRMIQPGESIGLKLTRDVPRGRVVFAFTANGEAASEGIVGV